MPTQRMIGLRTLRPFNAGRHENLLRCPPSMLLCLAVLSLVVLSLAGLTGCEIEDESGPRAAVPAPVISSDPPAAVAGDIVRGNLQFVHGYQAGQAEALRQGKPMLVFFTASWCRFCHELAEESFTDPQVVQLSQGFVCVLVDADQERNVCEMFGVDRFPTVQFLSPNGQPHQRLIGKKPAHRLAMEMQSALQTLARRPDGVRWQ